MSCVVGIKDIDTEIIYIGGDSRLISSEDGSVRVSKIPKVFVNGNLLIGYVGSVRTGQCLFPELWTPPKPKGFKKNVFTITESIREQLENMKCSVEGKEGEEMQSNFMVAYNKTLFVIYEDFQIELVTENYCSIGIGYQYALGSLWETTNLGLDPIERIKRALSCSSNFHSSVCPPFTIFSISKRNETIKYGTN